MRFSEAFLDELAARNDIVDVVSSYVELKRKGKHLMAYSGYTFEQLLELSDPFVKKLLGQLDLLVDGPFIMAEKNIELRFRGSANQRVLDVPKSLEANEAVWAEQYR